MHTFQPRSANTSQKPRPIPSVPPVTTAQFPYFLPYFYNELLRGISYFTTCHNNFASVVITTMHPINVNIVVSMC